MSVFGYGGALLVKPATLSHLVIDSNKSWEGGVTAGWHLANYAKRKLMTVTGSTSGAMTNYQQLLTIHFGGGVDSGGAVYLRGAARDDFNDIRFLKTDGTLLDYYVDTKVDGNYAVVLVKLDSVPIGPGTVDFWMYYGYPSAASASNFDNTRKHVVTIAEVVDDPLHAATTNIKTILEGSGYTVTVVTDDNVVSGAVDLSGYDLIVCVRTQKDLAGLGVKLRSYINDNIPLMAGMEAGIVAGEHVGTQLQLIGYTGKVRADNAEDEIAITNNDYYITAGFPPGDLTVATMNDFFESIEKATSVGISLADRKGFALYSGVHLVEAGTLDISSVAFGQRVCHIGHIYRNTSVDGNAIILEAVKWTGFRNYILPEPTVSWGSEEGYEIFYSITNLKELVSGMDKGDIVVFDGTKLIIITPGSIGSQLIAHDFGNLPTFGYPP